MDGVGVTRSDACQYGMVSTDKEGRECPVFKPIGWMSNANLLLKELSNRCQNQCGDHAVLLDGRAAGAAIYPPKLCAAIIRGLQRQWEQDLFLHSRVIVLRLACTQSPESWSGWSSSISMCMGCT